MCWYHQLSGRNVREALVKADGDSRAPEVPQRAASSEDLAMPPKDACQQLLSISPQGTLLSFCPARASLFPCLQLSFHTNYWPLRFL